MLFCTKEKIHLYKKVNYSFFVLQIKSEYTNMFILFFLDLEAFYHKFFLKSDRLIIIICIFAPLISNDRK